MSCGWQPTDEEIRHLAREDVADQFKHLGPERHGDFWLMKPAGCLHDAMERHPSDAEIETYRIEFELRRGMAHRICSAYATSFAAYDDLLGLVGRECRIAIRGRE